MIQYKLYQKWQLLLIIFKIENSINDSKWTYVKLFGANKNINAPNFGNPTGISISSAFSDSNYSEILQSKPYQIGTIRIEPSQRMSLPVIWNNKEIQFTRWVDDDFLAVEVIGLPGFEKIIERRKLNYHYYPYMDTTRWIRLGGVIPEKEIIWKRTQQVQYILTKGNFELNIPVAKGKTVVTFFPPHLAYSYYEK